MAKLHCTTRSLTCPSCKGKWVGNFPSKQKEFCCVHCGTEFQRA